MLALLSLFSLDQNELTVEQAAAALGSTVRTTYRYMRSLTAAGLVSTHHGGRYVLGPAAVQLDWVIRNTDPMTNASGPAMQILAHALEVPAVILLCRLYRNQVMCISQAAAGHPSFASSYQRGRPMPLFRGAASKAILAVLPSRTARNFYDQHPEQMAAAGLGETWKAVAASLKKMRTEGISVTSGELDPGLTGMACPIRGSEFTPTGSLALVIADSKLNTEVSSRCARLLRAAAEQVSQSLQSL